MFGQSFVRPWRFLKPDRTLRAVLASASREAGDGGITSLHLLIAALGRPEVRILFTQGGSDAAAVRAATQLAIQREERFAPGLTDDAKRVIDMLAHRSVWARRAPDAADVIWALLDAECEAKTVLTQGGVAENLARLQRRR